MIKKNRPSIKDTLNGRETRYSVVVAVAKRAREIASEAELNEEHLTRKPVSLSIEDFESGRFVVLEPEVTD
ncbi:MAG: DNA-directed RNA polymerase subunit omega [Oscillospiraceae bacterium]|jgi:DNA-directed RNA polymerase subunit omega|nr:DNA-directed RNA polymerase subunit omega [Oscillospiraceae bacterium]